MDSSISPFLLSSLVFNASSYFHGFDIIILSRSVLSGSKIPFESTIIIFPGLNPASIIRCAAAIFAAPDPIRDTVVSGIFLPAILRELMRPARIMQAVPSWSSCHAGMLNFSCNSLRTKKHFGLSISSRLYPPKDGSNAIATFINSSPDETLIGRGTALTPPNKLKIMALPSITGIAASGPTFPRPSTLVPSVIIPMEFHLPVSSNDSSGFLLITLDTSATPGVYQYEKSLTEEIGTLG